MFISIVIAMYNAEKYIKQCIDSLERCNLHDTEILLINDGSDDGTEAICQEYLGRQYSIRLYTKKNGGPASARNYGISRSGGKYILFVDSDDYVIPEQYNHFYSYLLRQEGADVLFNDYFVYNEHNQKRRETSYIKENGSNRRLADYIGAGNCFWNIWCNAYRREYLENNGCFFDERFRYGEDLDFTCKIMMAGGDFRFVHIPYYCYRFNRADSTMNTLSCRHLESLLTLINENYAELRPKRDQTSALLKKRLRREYLKATAIIYQLEGSDRNMARELFRSGKSPFGVDISIIAPCAYGLKRLWQTYKNAK
jgi:glycosyltransferase involved in cell wall biosynthesis